MAIFSIGRVSIRSIAVAVPKQASYIRNYDWVTEKEREQIIKSTGIEERRFAPPGICASDMAIDLCKYVFEKTGINTSEIDILVFVSQSGDYILPNSACIIQNKLGLKKTCMAFDITLGCSGYVYGLSVVAGILSAAGGALRNALFIAGDVSVVVGEKFQHHRFVGRYIW